MFVDRAKIFIKSGKGGNGAVSFRREPFVPEGGPDGGDGGKGGDVIFQADENLRTLMDFRYKRKYEAENGQDGMKKKRYGKNGQDLIIKVPVGTVVIDEESGLVMQDLTEHGQSFIAAKGGKGGKGNVKYTTSTRQAPNFAEAGGFAKNCNTGNEADCRCRTGGISKCRQVNIAFCRYKCETKDCKLSFHNYRT